MAQDSLSLSHSGRIDNLYSVLLKQLCTLANIIGRIDNAHEYLTTQMLGFENCGLVNARLFYHQGKYLYLIHPAKNGKRQREYVGSNPRKVADAERRASNYKAFAANERELLRLEAEATKLLTQLSSITATHQGAFK